MDRISAIRNLEDALREFDHGEATLEETERRAVAVLRTYATEFEGSTDVYRAVGPDPAGGTVVVAPSKAAARARIAERIVSMSAAGTDECEPSDAPEFEVERL
ncbi:hypothetical protein ACFQAS_10930 [Halopenitus salinus]|uniref:Uncharacterized protein n=1 Tax=Halopenitus salinus TaxID=1198295 RepID=A0ABD5USX6_9EURY